MRKRVLAIALMTTVFAMSLTACDKNEDSKETTKNTETKETTKKEEETIEETTEETTKKEEKTTYDLEEYGYDKILQQYDTYLTTGGDDYEGETGYTAIMETIHSEGAEAPTELVGFGVEDLSGDGIPELYIGRVTGYTEENEGTTTTDIYAVYTCVNGSPQFVFEGWSRNSYTYAGDGIFMNSGSAGADSSCYGKYELTEDATALNCKDFYFSCAYDENYDDIRYYHNTSGDWDIDVSEELDWDSEYFFDYQTQYGEAMPLDIRTFDKYDGELDVNSPDIDANVSTGSLSIQEVTDLSLYDDYSEYTVSTEEPLTYAMLSTDGEIKKLKIYNIELVDAEGELPIFNSTLNYDFGTITSDVPLVLDIPLVETIPTVGISYVDENGITVYYAIQLSGEDGSLYLGQYSNAE